MSLSLETNIVKPESEIKSAIILLHGYGGDGKDISMLSLNWKRHLTNTIEIIGGDTKKSLMIGDSETDSNASKAADIPFILLEDGYTEKKNK